MIRSYSGLSSIGVMLPSGHEERIAYRPFSPSKACSTSCELLTHHLLAFGEKGLILHCSVIFSANLLWALMVIFAPVSFTLYSCVNVSFTHHVAQSGLKYSTGM